MLQVGRRSLAGPPPDDSLWCRVWKGWGLLPCLGSPAASSCALQEVAATRRSQADAAESQATTGWRLPIHPHLLPTASCGCPAPLPGGGGICKLSCPVPCRTLWGPPHLPLRDAQHGWGAWKPTLSAISFPAGALGIVNSGLIPSLVLQLHTEHESIQEILLDTLASCLLEDANEALASRAVPFLKEMLLSNNNNIRTKAASTLTAVR